MEHTPSRAVHINGDVIARTAMKVWHLKDALDTFGSEMEPKSMYTRLLYCQPIYSVICLYANGMPDDLTISM